VHWTQQRQFTKIDAPAGQSQKQKGSGLHSSQIKFFFNLDFMDGRQEDANGFKYFNKGDKQDKLNLIKTLGCFSGNIFMFFSAGILSG